ncbi:hypothetical protein [Streptomyces sp. NPDC058614]|uniref:hypothetical protein n=1 Tax=Streptomyces sp. NPDC058614 TaxID=3346557 RepID=UPI003668C81F
MAIDRFWDDGRRQIRVRLRDDSEAEPWSTDPFWTYDFGPDHQYRPRTEDYWFSWIRDDNHQLQQQAKFLCDVADDIFAHGLQPWADVWGTAVVTFHATTGRPVVSAANALVHLWLTSDQDSTPADLTAAFDVCLQIALNGFAPFDADTRRRFRLVFLRRLAADWERLEHDWVERAIRAIHEGGKDATDEGPQFLDAAREILPAPLAALWPDEQ